MEFFLKHIIQHNIRDNEGLGFSGQKNITPKPASQCLHSVLAVLVRYKQTQNFTIAKNASDVKFSKIL